MTQNSTHPPLRSVCRRPVIDHDLFVEEVVAVRGMEVVVDRGVMRSLGPSLMKIVAEALLPSSR